MYTAQLAVVEVSIHEIMYRMDSVIKTIPGIGYLNGAMIIGEIGDISRFEKPCQLLAYAGLDPSVYQSGNFKCIKNQNVQTRLQTTSLCPHKRSLANNPFK